MKAQLRVMPHTVLRGQFIFEVWYDGEFIAQVAGADGPGVRIISKHKRRIENPDELVTDVFLERG